MAPPPSLHPTLPEALHTATTLTTMTRHGVFEVAGDTTMKGAQSIQGGRKLRGLSLALGASEPQDTPTVWLALILYYASWA